MKKPEKYSKRWIECRRIIDVSHLSDKTKNKIFKNLFEMRGPVTIFYEGHTFDKDIPVVAITGIIYEFIRDCGVSINPGKKKKPKILAPLIPKNWIKFERIIAVSFWFFVSW